MRANPSVARPTIPSTGGSTPSAQSAAPDRWEPWKAAGGVFVASRALILFVTYIAANQLGTGTTHAPTLRDPHGSPWFHWDATLFAQIAQQGYSTHGHSALTVAFFPLWPLLMHLLGAPFGTARGVYYIAGLILANVCFYVAAAFFYILLRDDFGVAVARRGVVYLAFYPFAVYFFLGYSESLFLLLVLGVFLALQRGTLAGLWLAGALGFLAVLTRAVGVAVMVPIVVVAIQRSWPIGVRLRQWSWLGQVRSEWRSLWRMTQVLAPAALVPLGIVGYMIYLGHIAGNPLLFQRMEASNWHRQLTWPWVGIFGALHSVFVGAYADLSVVDLVFLILPLGVLVLGWRRLPAHYRLFAAALILITLCEPVAAVEPLTSVPRYIMVAFPIIAICAHWGKDARFDRAYMALGGAMLALTTALFVAGHWVA